MPELPSGKSQETLSNVYAFGATSFLNDTASEMAYWVLPAFLASLGAGPAQLGIIEGIAESVASFAKLFSGYFADRVARRKPIVVLGYVVANAVKPLLAVATSWWHVLFIRFADRFAKGVRGAPRDVMVTESVDRSKIGSAYGLIQAMDSAGAIAGPMAAILLLPRFGLRGIFWAAAVPGFLCIVIAAVYIREPHPKSSSPSPAQDASTKVNAGNSFPLTNSLRTSLMSTAFHLPGSFYYVLFAVTLFSLANSSDMFLVMRAQSIGIPATHAPLLGLVFNITYTLFSWPAGRYSDRFSRRSIAGAGYIVFAVVYFVFALAPSRFAIWLSMALYGLFYALSTPVLKALVVDTVGASVRGSALGVYFFVTSVATLAASVMTGELWKHYGARLPFSFSSLLAVVSSMLLLASRRKQSRKPA